MAEIELALLGTVRVTVDGEERPIGSRRQRALLALVGLAPRTRDTLVTELWPDADERRGRQNLRQALYEIGAAVRAEVVAAQGATLRVADGVRVDIRELERAAGGGTEDDLRRAFSLYAGDLCAEAEGVDAEGERVRLRGLFAGAAEALAARRLDAAPDEAEAIARRVIHVDPYREEAHRLLLRALARAGDLAGAAAQYRRMTALLRDELGIEPSAETKRVYAALDREARSGYRPVRRPSLEPPCELVGRRAEYAALMTLVTDAIDGRGRSALVVGEAGAGKSRLIHEIAAVAEQHEVRVLRAGATAAEGALPFQVWVNALASCGAEAMSLPPPWPAVLATLLPELEALEAGGVAPELGRTRLFEAVARLLAHMSRDAPTLLVLDDVHQADADSLQLLHYLTRILRGRRLGLVAAARPVAAGSSLDAVRLSLEARGELAPVALGPLPAAAVTELLERSGLGEDASWLGPRVHAWTGGNPFFALEVLRALADQSRLRRDGHGWRWTGDRPASEDPLAPDLPPTVRQSVLGRLGALPSACRRLLDLVALIGSPARLRTLALVAGRDELVLADDLAPALEAGLLREPADGTAGLSFAHDLVADAIYQQIPSGVRAAIHRRAAAALDSLGGPSLSIARHLAAAGETARAVDHWVAGARDAAARMAHDEAIRGYRAALEALGPTSARRAEILLAIGDTWMRRGVGTEAVRAYDAALTVLPADEETLRAAIGVRLAAAARFYERHPRARELAEAAIAHYAARSDAPRLCEALVSLAWVRYIDRDADGALGVAEEARALARSIGDPRSEVGALRVAVLARWLAGESLVAPDAEDVERLVESAGDDDEIAALLGMVSIALLRRGETRAAADAARRALEMARRIGSMRVQLTAGEQLVRALRVAGELDAAIAEADEILVETAALDLPQPADMVGELLLALALAEDRDRALPLARELLARHDSPDPPTHGGPTLYAANALLTLGEPLVREVLDRARPLCSTCLSGWLAVAGRHAALSGDADRALALAGEFVDRAVAGSVQGPGLAESIRALVHARRGDTEAAARSSDQARAALRASGQRYHLELLERDLARARALGARSTG